jgi:guanylate kinase
VDGDARPDARLTVLTGPSWAGRDSVVELVRARAPFVRVPVSVTTRRRRAHEVDGVHYTFVDRPAFERLIADQLLLEWAELGGNLYGTPREPVEAWLRAGEPVLLVLDTVGAGLVKAAMPEARLVRLTAAAGLPAAAPPAGTAATPAATPPAAAPASAAAASSAGSPPARPADPPTSADADVTVVNDSAERAADELVSLLGSSCLTPARPPVGG